MQVECSSVVHRGEGGDTAALTFTAIQELFVVTGLETNAEPKGRRSGLNFIHSGGASVGKDKQRKQLRCEVFLLSGKSINRHV